MTSVLRLGDRVRLRGSAGPIGVINALDAWEFPDGSLGVLVEFYHHLATGDRQYVQVRYADVERVPEEMA